MLWFLLCSISFFARPIDHIDKMFLVFYNKNKGINLNPIVFCPAFVNRYQPIVIEKHCK